MCKISRWNSKSLLRKPQKILGGYFILPHPVYIHREILHASPTNSLTIGYIWRVTKYCIVTVPLNIIFILNLSYLFLELQNNTKFVLETLSDNLFTTNRFDIQANSLFKVKISLSKFALLRNIFVSSANSIKCKIFEVLINCSLQLCCKCIISK